MTTPTQNYVVYVYDPNAAAGEEQCHTYTSCSNGVSSVGTGLFDEAGANEFSAALKAVTPVLDIMVLPAEAGVIPGV